MKKLFFVGIMALCLLTLTGCFHEHVFNDATCDTPKTCAECGETEGVALGHAWQAATCIQPSTCAKCGSYQGNALGHNWSAATCTQPSTCLACNETTGQPNGHRWTPATCFAAQTCTACGATEGTSLPHNWEPATCTSPQTCTRCALTTGVPSGHLWTNATCTMPKFCVRCQITSGTTKGHSVTTSLRCNNCRQEMIYTDFAYLATSTFNSVKYRYSTATPHRADIEPYINLEGDVCVIVSVYYSLISTYDETVLYNLTDGKTIRDPFNYYCDLAADYYGASKLHYLDLGGEYLEQLLYALENDEYIPASQFYFGD